MLVSCGGRGPPPQLVWARYRTAIHVISPEQLHDISRTFQRLWSRLFRALDLTELLLWDVSDNVFCIWWNLYSGSGIGESRVIFK